MNLFKSSPFLSLAFILSLAFSAPNANALYTDTFEVSGDWESVANWKNGVLIWENSAGDGVVDFTVSANMTIGSSPVWTGSQFGSSAGTPFQVRRITIGGARTLTIQAGGVVDFGGGADSRILMNSTGASMVITGGELKTSRSNLGGINLGGAFGTLEISGGTIDISDPGASYNPGIVFSGVTSASGAVPVIGSKAAISLEKIAFTGTNDAKFRFTLDNAGVSSIGVTELFDLTVANTTTTLQLYLSTGVTPAPSKITLFDLGNGSLGAFSQVVTSRGTFSAEEGSLIEIASATSPEQYLTYKLTYGLDGNDIGLILAPVPEPSSVALFLAAGGAMVFTVARRRTSRP